jgi:glycosyltransferase involved in cell wall biosynthesis
MREPRLSVIIPAFNAEAFLAEAIESVRHQSYRNLEIIVVDDGSTDATAGIAARFAGVRVLAQGRGGPSAARNRGLRAADGDLVAFLDADDWWSASKLATQLPRLREDPNLEAVSGYVQCVRPAGRAAGGGAVVDAGPPRLLPSFGSLVARRAAFDRVGALDESLRHGEDIDWFMRSRALGLRSVAVPEVVLYYRLHGGNATHGTTPDEIGYARAVKKLLDQRRGAERRASPRER